MRTKLHSRRRVRLRTAQDGFTLAEVCVALFISVVMFGGMILGFVESAQQAEWSSYNLAAQSLAQQGIEQARAAQWDPWQPVDNCITNNFPTVTTNILDIPYNSTNYIYATNKWTITTFTNSLNYPYKFIKVETTWLWQRQYGWSSTVFTNTVATIRAPDRDQ